MASSVDIEVSRNRVQWLASLDTEAKPGHKLRRTSIICTIGIVFAARTAGRTAADHSFRPEDQFGGKDQHASQGYVNRIKSYLYQVMAKLFSWMQRGSHELLTRSLRGKVIALQ